MLPEHIGFIMDGNGRWAKMRGLPRNVGHRQGLETAKKVITFCREKGIKYVSLFVFSTENWKRPQSEVKNLFSLAERYLSSIVSFAADKIRIIHSGELSGLPNNLAERILDAERETMGNSQCVVNLCINYGGQAEIVALANKMVQSGKQFTVEEFSSIICGQLPPLDYVVRTGGQMRISNFMLFQMAYAEMIFIDTLWPDFDKKEFDDIIAVYEHRTRNFGGIKE